MTEALLSQASDIRPGLHRLAIFALACHVARKWQNEIIWCWFALLNHPWNLRWSVPTINSKSPWTGSFINYQHNTNKSIKLLTCILHSCRSLFLSYSKLNLFCFIKRAQTQGCAGTEGTCKLPWLPGTLILARIRLKTTSQDSIKKNSKFKN